MKIVCHDLCSLSTAPTPCIFTSCIWSLHWSWRWSRMWIYSSKMPIFLLRSCILHWYINIGWRWTNSLFPCPSSNFMAIAAAAAPTLFPDVTFHSGSVKFPASVYIIIPYLTMISFRLKTSEMFHFGDDRESMIDTEDWRAYLEIIFGTFKSSSWGRVKNGTEHMLRPAFLPSQPLLNVAEGLIYESLRCSHAVWKIRSDRRFNRTKNLTHGYNFLR